MMNKTAKLAFLEGYMCKQSQPVDYKVDNTRATTDARHKFLDNLRSWKRQSNIVKER